MSFKYSKISTFAVGLLWNSAVLCANQGAIQLKHSEDDNSVELRIALNARGYTQEIDFTRPNLVEAGNLQTPFGRINFDNVDGENIAVINSNGIKISFDSNCNLNLRLEDFRNSPIRLNSFIVLSDGNVCLEDKLGGINWSIMCGELTVISINSCGQLKANVDAFTSQTDLYFDALKIRPRIAAEAAVTTQGLFIKNLLKLNSCRLTAENLIQIEELRSENSYLRILNTSQNAFFEDGKSTIWNLTGRINGIYLGDDVKLSIRLVALATPPTELQGTGKLIFGRKLCGLRYSISDERAMEVFHRLIAAQDFNNPRDCSLLLAQGTDYLIEVNHGEEELNKTVRIENNITGECAEFNLNFDSSEIIRISSDWLSFFFDRRIAKIVMPQLAVSMSESSTEFVPNRTDETISMIKLVYRDPLSTVNINNGMAFDTLDIECDEFRNQKCLEANAINIKANLTRNTGKIFSTSFSVSAIDENTGGSLYNHGEMAIQNMNIAYTEVKTYVKTWRNMDIDFVNFDRGSLSVDKVENWPHDENSSNIDFKIISGTPRSISLKGEDNELTVNYWLGTTPEVILGEGGMYFSRTYEIVKLNTADAAQNLAAAIQNSHTAYSERENSDSDSDSE